jgi:hypothetical protein
VVLDPLDRCTFEELLTEARTAGPAGRSQFDTHAGLAVRRWCAPLLGLPAHADPTAYLERRGEVGPHDAAQILLRACRASDLLVDTGLSWPGLSDPARLAGLAGARVHEVTRVEAVVEEVATGDVSAAGLGPAIAEALARHASRSVAFKTVAAYRVGLELPDVPPTEREVRRAADRWLPRCAVADRCRLDDPVLVAHAVWSCLRLGLPLQVHTGYGDSDLTLHRVDPSLLTPFLRAVGPGGPPVALLHCYPYHRQAAYLASVFPQVVLDVSLAVNHVGPRSLAVLAECLELAPFGSVLYASDGFGLPELHLLGAVLFRDALARLLDRWVAEDVLTATDARRYARMVAGDNARRVYRLAAG